LRSGPKIDGLNQRTIGRTKRAGWNVLRPRAPEIRLLAWNARCGSALSPKVVADGVVLTREDPTTAT
jgi:hypothetical protein